MSELTELHERLTSVIIGTCNTIGCKDCDLKWDDGCSASDLGDRISDIEFKELEQGVNK